MLLAISIMIGGIFMVSMIAIFQLTKQREEEYTKLLTTLNFQTCKKSQFINL